MALTLHALNGATAQLADACSVRESVLPDAWDLSTALPGQSGGTLVGEVPLLNLFFVHLEN